ncbi:MAG TPA: family 16 glycoside hydrolase [Opitutaceae bacterium]|nr:family 16 glycoside hydrolase [Opitutaceae bacterium]
MKDILRIFASCSGLWLISSLAITAAELGATTDSVQSMNLRGDAAGPRFDGIGPVDGGGATSVLLKDYPEPQRSQILDLVYKPKCGASVNALLVEIPGDGNSTQGSMPSHMHTREDLNYSRGYIWWILQEAKKRNPDLSLDGAAWSAPGWLGSGNFWSQDTADYYVKWLQGLRDEYKLEFDAIGCRNERGVSIEFAKIFRATLNAGGFSHVKLHGFDNWPKSKFDFVKELQSDPQARAALDILSAHTFYAKSDGQVSPEVQAAAFEMGKPIWNTEDHVYKKGFDCAISIVQCFNENFIRSGATRVVLWYDIAAIYAMEPYSVDPAMLLAHSPWSGHYEVREALWGYAHYGQFTHVGWHYMKAGCQELRGGGSVVAMKSPTNDYSIIIETRDAKAPQHLQFNVGGGLSSRELCVWRSNANEQFVRQADAQPRDGVLTLTVEPGSIYSLSTTTGQQKGSFDSVPAARAFPFPYHETFDEYKRPETYGYLPRYFADISGAFELVARPDGGGQCLQQVVPIPTLSWAPDWLPYTIIGDDKWQDYEANVDVYLKPDDSAAMMGRINDVGTGWGFIPKGYYLQLSHDGECRLVVVRGKINKKKPAGDAEQQALLKAQNDASEGGEKVLTSAKVRNIQPNQWHTLTLRFKGSEITGLVDGREVVSANDALYTHGMAGLLAQGTKTQLSMPYFDNVIIKSADAAVPKPAIANPGQGPIYSAARPRT